MVFGPRGCLPSHLAPRGALLRCLQRYVNVWDEQLRGETQELEVKGLEKQNWLQALVSMFWLARSAKYLAKAASGRCCQER